MQQQTVAAYGDLGSHRLFLLIRIAHVRLATDQMTLDVEVQSKGGQLSKLALFQLDEFENYEDAPIPMN